MSFLSITKKLFDEGIIGLRSHILLHAAVTYPAVHICTLYLLLPLSMTEEQLMNDTKSNGLTKKRVNRYLRTCHHEMRAKSQDCGQIKN